MEILVDLQDSACIYNEEQAGICQIRIQDRADHGKGKYSIWGGGTQKKHILILAYTGTYLLDRGNDWAREKHILGGAESRKHCKPGSWEVLKLNVVRFEQN